MQSFAAGACQERWLPQARTSEGQLKVSGVTVSRWKLRAGRTRGRREWLCAGRNMASDGLRCIDRPVRGVLSAFQCVDANPLARRRIAFPNDPLPQQATMEARPRLRRMRHFRIFRPAALFLALALLPWQAVWPAVSPRQACCSLNPAAGQCRRECPMKASPEHEAGAAGPSIACHRSSSASGASAKCGIRSRCSSDHSKAIWNPEAPYLPAFAAALPLLARMPFQPSPLTPDWPRRHDSPPAPPPQPAIPG